MTGLVLGVELKGTRYGRDLLQSVANAVVGVPGLVAVYMGLVLAVGYGRTLYREGRAAARARSPG